MKHIIKKKCLIDEIFSEGMGGGKDSPAYYVTIQKEKTVKAFYWMINSSKVYSSGGDR